MTPINLFIAIHAATEIILLFLVLYLLDDRKHWRKRAEAAQSAMACACELRELRAHELSIY